MRRSVGLPPAVERDIAGKTPFLWLNERWQPLQEALLGSDLRLDHVHEAEQRWNRFSTLLTALFPELQASGGIIESSFCPANGLRNELMPDRSRSGRWFIKCDHALPIAGSIKARGGIYEVLVHAEHLALCNGLIRQQDDRRLLASPRARELFARHELAVGSTGNLGLSVGVIAVALGFRVTVHMSSDAKEWKKQRLRVRGAEVIEHEGDFGSAVAAGRTQANGKEHAYFIDDENSRNLFLGYSVAALRLQRQLSAQSVQVDAQHPLFVYLPCGVGGAPGGITFGLRHLLGDHVHCFFAEPVASPCMLIRLASAEDAPLCVQDLGLDNRTEADGLAVARASQFVAPLMRPLVSGIFTVPDTDLFEDLYLLEQREGLRIEPSAAAGFRGPRWLLESEQGREYLSDHGAMDHLVEAAHVLWTTGGSLVPDAEYARFHERGRLARQVRAS